MMHMEDVPELDADAFFLFDAVKDVMFRPNDAHSITGRPDIDFLGKFSE